MATTDEERGFVADREKKIKQFTQERTSTREKVVSRAVLILFVEVDGGFTQNGPGKKEQPNFSINVPL